LRDKTRLPKSKYFICNLGQANRDYATFENPHELQLDRKEKPEHLSFGWGQHICIGRHVVRIEARIAIAAIIRRMENLRLAAGSKPAWLTSPLSTHVTSLMVEHGTTSNDE